MRRHPGRLVFIDETSVNTKMARLRGRAKRGKRLKASAPFGKWGTQTFIAERWLGKTAQRDKWIFCLTAAKAAA